MLDYMGWQESAQKIRKALQATIKDGVVTYDLARQTIRTTTCNIKNINWSIN